MEVTNCSKKKWTDLEQHEQLLMREEYGHYLDSLPPTCSMDTKIDRFCRWLVERGVEFDAM